MKITKIEIKNFRNHKDTVIELNENTVLIGKNNTGKTSFLEALKLVLDKTGRKYPVEDDFYTTDTFNETSINPIEIILEFKEFKENRFSGNIVSDFQNVWQYDKSTLEYEEPLKYIKLYYKAKYKFEDKKIEIERYFLNDEKKEIKSEKVSNHRLSYFPFFYLETLRDIHKQINYKNSFWGDLKKDIRYNDKTQANLQTQIDEINTLLLTHPDINKLKEELKLLQKNLNQSTGDLYLQAFSKRNWELLDQLDIFVKNSNTNFALPISRHGSGTQNIATFLIFKAYINLLLKKVVSNPEAFPIIAIEEPEAHIHPQAQRELFGEIKELKGQKIISTHSIFIVEQTDIYDIVLLKNNQGISTAHQIPKFKKQLKPNLPAIAYEKNKTLNKKEESMIKRYVKYKQAEIFFSNLFILCEGDSEKLFLEQIIPYYKNKTIGQLGISVINCDGKNYTTFLKVAKLLEMNWIIFSDAEEDTKKEVKKQSKNVGFKEQKINENIIFLPKNADFEKLYIDFYGENIIKEFITEIFDKDIFQNFKNDAKEGLEKRNESKNYSEKELLNKFIDSKGKPHMAEKLANYIIKKKLEIPKVIKELIDKSYSKLS